MNRRDLLKSAGATLATLALPLQLLPAPPPDPWQEVVVPDWGILHNIDFLHPVRLRLGAGATVLACNFFAPVRVVESGLNWAIIESMFVVDTDDYPFATEGLRVDNISAQNRGRLLYNWILHR